MTVARRYKLDPFRQQIWFVRRWDKNAENGVGGKGAFVWTPQVGINGLLFCAARDHRKDFGSISLPEYGPMVEVAPNVKAPEWARVKVWKRGFAQPTEAEAWWTEYAPYDLDKAPFWRKMPRHMLGKCAKALAVRAAYPDLGGLYIPEECERMAEDVTESGRQIIEGPLVGSKEAADAVARRKVEEYNRTKQLVGESTSDNKGRESFPTQSKTAPAPKKIVSITMPSDASDVAYAWGDLTAEILEVIKGPCLGIKLEDKDVYAMPADKVVPLESECEKRGYLYQEVSALPSPKSDAAPPAADAKAAEAAAPSEQKGAPLGQGAPAAETITGIVKKVKPNQVSPKSKKTYYAVLIDAGWLYVYRTTLWPIFDQCQGMQVEVTVKNKVIQGFKRVHTRMFEADGATPIVQNSEERPKGGRLFV